MVLWFWVGVVGSLARLVCLLLSFGCFWWIFRLQVCVFGGFVLIMVGFAVVRVLVL